MIGDDLTGLLLPPDGPEFGFRQGTILTFDIVSGANTIDVAGATLTNVPFLNPGGYTILLPGDVVVLLRMRSSWAILGRITAPGGTRAIGRYTELSSSYSVDGASNYSLTTTPATKATLSIPVPVWCEVATVTASLMLMARNSTATTDFLVGKILMPDGASTTWLSGSVPTVSYGSVTVTKHHQLAVTPGGTLTILGQAAASVASWGANANNVVTLQATVAFNSNDG